MVFLAVFFCYNFLFIINYLFTLVYFFFCIYYISKFVFQEKAKKSWFERNAESIELVLDDNDSEDERANKHKQKKASSAHLKKLQQVSSFHRYPLSAHTADPPLSLFVHYYAKLESSYIIFLVINLCFILDLLVQK